MNSCLVRIPIYLFAIFVFNIGSIAFAREHLYSGIYRETVIEFLDLAKKNGVKFKFPSCKGCGDNTFPDIDKEKSGTTRERYLAYALDKAYIAELYSMFGMAEDAVESAQGMMDDLQNAYKFLGKDKCKYFCRWEGKQPVKEDQIKDGDDNPSQETSKKSTIRECVYAGKNSKHVCEILRYAKHNGVKFKFLSCPTCLDVLYPSVPKNKVRSQYDRAISRALEKAFATEQLARLNLHAKAERISGAVMKELAEANSVRGKRKCRYFCFWKNPGKKGTEIVSPISKASRKKAKTSGEKVRRYAYKGYHNDIVIDLLENARLNGVKFKFSSCPTCMDGEYPKLPPGSVVNQRDRHIASALDKAYVVETYARRELAGQAAETAVAMMDDIKSATRIGFDIKGYYMSSWKTTDEISSSKNDRESKKKRIKTQAMAKKNVPPVKSKLIGVVYADTMILDQPSIEGSELSKTSRETESLVIGRSDEGKWVLIKTIDNMIGWIPLNGLKEFRKLSHEIVTLAQGAGDVSKVVKLEETIGKLVKRAIIRKNPSDKSRRLWSGKAADRYKVIGKSKNGEWARILLKDGTEGWIARNMIEEIKTRVTSEVVGWIIGNLPLGSANIGVGKDGISVRLVDGDRVHQVKIGASGASYATVKQTEEGVTSHSVAVGAHGVRYSTSTENKEGSEDQSIGVNTSGLNYSKKTIKEDDNSREVARSDLDVGKGGLSFTHKKETLKRRFKPLDSVNLTNMLLSIGGVIFEGGGVLSLGMDLGWRYLDPSGNFPGSEGGSRNAFDFRLAFGGTYNPPTGGGDQSGSIHVTATIGYTYLSFKENKTKTLENSGWGFNLGLMGGAGYNLGDYSAFLPIIGPNIGFEWFKYNPGEASYSSSQLVFLLIPVPGAMVFTVSYGGSM